MNTDLHTVIEAKRMRDGSFAYRAVTPNLGWGEAQEIWTELDDRRREVMSEHYFMVRAANDPDWSWLARPSIRGGFNGADKATKDWGKAQGYEGRAGGWIYGLSGRVHGQGWGSLVGFAMHRQGIRSLIMSNGKRGWYNTQSEYQFREDQVVAVLSALKIVDQLNITCPHQNRLSPPRPCGDCDACRANEALGSVLV